MKIPERFYLPLAFAGGFVVGLVVLGGVVMYQMAKTVPVPVKIAPPVVVQQTPTAQEPEQTPTTESTTGSFQPRVDTRTVAFDVKWTGFRLLTHDEAVSLFTAEPTPYTHDAIEKSLATYTTSTQAIQGDGGWTIWEAGVVNSGVDEGDRVFVLQETELGMGTYYSHTYLVQNAQVPSNIYAVGATSTAYEDGQKISGGVWPIDAYAIHMPDASIPSLELPGTLTLDNGKTIIRSTMGGWVDDPGFRSLIEAPPGEVFNKIGHTTDGRDVFELASTYSGDNTVSREGCLYVFGPDGSVNKYSSTIPGATQNDSTYGQVYMPSITWMDGTTNTVAYNAGKPGGCGGGFDCVYNVDASKVGPISSLNVVGKTPAGEPVYAPKMPTKNSFFKDAYDSWYIPDGNKPGIEEFVKKYPYAVIFWKDAVGRWTTQRIQSLMPAAECGKPVIYLYPQQTERVSVALPSFINVTKSEPTYPAKGWVVTAHPDGSLEYADGNTYGSLYWEGTGVGYQTPKDGFIIKDGTVDQRLTEILAKYGLNAKESQEFRDFWVPKMTGAPYYRVSFLTSDWSKAAPLSVFPHPQTSIRIFMDWQKLNAPISLPEPKVVTPARNGFTLVEWGGLLRK